MPISGPVNLLCQNVTTRMTRAATISPTHVTGFPLASAGTFASFYHSVPQFKDSKYIGVIGPLGTVSTVTPCLLKVSDTHLTWLSSRVFHFWELHWLPP